MEIIKKKYIYNMCILYIYILLKLKPYACLDNILYTYEVNNIFLFSTYIIYIGMISKFIIHINEPMEKKII